MSATDFWQEHQVGGPYETLTESFEALVERELLYPELAELMPTKFPGKRILDFGCGPGHDTILFLNHEAEHVYYADVSWQALDTTAKRLNMHGWNGSASPLFADDDLPAVDHAHCAGVLHHMHDPLGALQRIRDVSPTLNVMIYDGDRSLHTQSLVPITEWWTEKEFKRLAAHGGWKAEYKGSYECSAAWRPSCYAACYWLT